MDLIDVKFKNIVSKYDKLKISSVKYLEKFTDNDIIDREYFIINQQWVDEQTWPYNLNDLGINNFKIVGDLTFNSNDMYFTFNRGSGEDILFDGNGYKIILHNCNNYPGLFNFNDQNYYFDINIINLGVTSDDSTLQTKKGWIIGIAPKDSNKLIINNCYSVGEVPEWGGGIIGSASGIGSYIHVSNCYSISNSINNYAGGIIGAGTGNSKINDRKSGIEITNCYSDSKFIRKKAGGIVGYGSNSKYTEYFKVTNCYSSGKIFDDGNVIVFDKIKSSNYVKPEINLSGGSSTGDWEYIEANKYLTNIFIPSSKNINPTEESIWVFFKYRKGYLLKYQYDNLEENYKFDMIKEREELVEKDNVLNEMTDVNNNDSFWDEFFEKKETFADLNNKSEIKNDYIFISFLIVSIYLFIYFLVKFND